MFSFFSKKFKKILEDIPVEHIKHDPVFAVGDVVKSLFPGGHDLPIVEVIEVTSYRYLLECNLTGERRWNSMKEPPNRKVVKIQMITHYEYMVEYPNGERKRERSGEFGN